MSLENSKTLNLSTKSGSSSSDTKNQPSGGNKTKAKGDINRAQLTLKDSNKLEFWRDNWVSVTPHNSIH